MVALTIGSDSYEDQRDADLYRFAQRESGYRNITQTSGGPASGFFQMEDSSRGGSGTWETAAAWAGLPKRPDGTYGRAMDYDEDQQWAAARALYDRRGSKPWEASDPNRTLAQLGGGSAADQANLGMGNLDRLFQQKQAEQAPIYAGMMEQYKQDKLRFDKVAENYEPIQAVQTPPAAPPNDPLKGFASIGSIFAALASGFTHTPAINAMNGMAAAINATKKGDWEQYEAGYKQWKDNVEIAIQHHKLQAEDMKNAMEMMRDNLAAGVATANAVAAQTQDAISMELLRQGNYVKLEELRLHRQEAADRMKTAAEDVQLKHEQVVKIQRENAAAADLTKAMQTGDQEQIDKALTNYGSITDPVGAIGRMNTTKAQSIAADPHSYDPETGKMTPDAERAIMKIDPKLALDIKKSELDKLQMPKAYKLPDGKIVMARVSPTGPTVDMAGNPIDLSKAVPAQASDYNQVTYSDKQMGVFVDQYIASGGKDRPPLPWGPSGNQARQKFGESLEKRLNDLNMTGADIPGIGAVLAADRGALTQLIKQNASINAFSDTAVQNGKVLIDLAEKVDVTGLPMFEKWIRAGRKAIYGDPDVTAFDAQLRVYSNEVAKIISNPNLTGVLSDKARQEVESFTPESANLNQIKTLTSLFEGDFGRRLNANEAAIAEITRNARSPLSTRVVPQGKPATTGAAPTETVTVSDKASFDALPSGSHYRKPTDPPGSYRTKP